MTRVTVITASFVLEIVRYYTVTSPADWCQNCWIYGKSIKFGTRKRNYQLNNFSYGPTWDPPPSLHNLRKKIGSPVDLHGNEAHAQDFI